MTYALVVAVVFVAAVAAWDIYTRRLTRHPPEVLRTNVRGIEVPAVLGDALVGGALVGTALLLVIEIVAGGVVGETAAVAIVLVVLWAAGAWDDRQGDERPRGFRGHLGALRGLTLTGGLVKIAAGVIAGAAAAALLPANGAPPARHVAETVFLVGLSANLVNLLDRAPGRAAKVALLWAALLLWPAPLPWTVSVAPVLGALLACLGPDLRERAMLGDAGANPLGAVLGLGLTATLTEPGRLIAIAALVLLTLASEKWSFSRAIEAVPPLRWVDGLGRKDQLAAK